MPQTSNDTIDVTEVGRRGLELVERVAGGEIGRIVLTKGGRPVAAIVPMQAEPARSIVAALRELMEPVPGVDDFTVTADAWDAEHA